MDKSIEIIFEGEHRWMDTAQNMHIIFLYFNSIQNSLSAIQIEAEHIRCFFGIFFSSKGNMRFMSRLFGNLLTIPIRIFSVYWKTLNDDHRWIIKNSGICPQQKAAMWNATITTRNRKESITGEVMLRKDVWVHTRTNSSWFIGHGYRNHKLKFSNF